MLKTYLYIPKDLADDISFLAQNLRVSKASVIRNALKEGIKVVKRKRGDSLEAMTRIAEIGKRHKAKGPRDLSINLDKYLWDKYES